MQILVSTNFLEVDFTVIKNKSLAGTDLSINSFAHSNLSGVNLSGAIMEANNFRAANLSDLDFTVISNASIIRSVYQGANLSNANFEDVNLYDNGIYRIVFPGKAMWADKSNLELTDILNTHLINRWITEKQVVGNDLVFRFYFFQ